MPVDFGQYLNNRVARLCTPQVSPHRKHKFHGEGVNFHREETCLWDTGGDGGRSVRGRSVSGDRQTIEQTLLWRALKNTPEVLSKSATYSEHERNLLCLEPQLVFR